MSTPTDRADRTSAPSRPGLALTVLATAQLMLVLDGAVVNTALPSMQTALHLADRDLAWVVNGYVLSFGSLLLLGGRAGDHFGRRRTFVVGIGFFTLASLIGGLAANGTLLITARVFQGIGAAIASPTALALVSTSFPAGPPRTRALAVFSAAAGAGTAVGLIAGGLLTDFFSWRGVMFVNVPIGVLVLLAAPRVLVESSRHRGRIDVLGAVLAGTGLGTLVYGISRAGDPSHGWGDPVALVCVILALVVLAVFVGRQAAIPDPLLPLGLFRDRGRACAYVVVLLVGASLSLTYFLSLQVQHVMGYSPLRAGLAFLPFAVGIAGGSWLAARLAVRLPPRAVMGAGLLLAIIGVLFYRRFTAESSYAGDLLGPMLVWSTGMGMTFVPMTVTVLTGVEGRQAGIASAVMGTMQQVGGAIGLAALVTVSSAFRTEHLGRAVGVSDGEAGARQAATEAIEAAVHGYSAAYTASLVVLVIAGLVTVVGVTTSTQATRVPSADTDPDQDGQPITRTEVSRHQPGAAPADRNGIVLDDSRAR